MKYLPYCLAAALLLSAAGCSKPAEPEAAPIPVAQAKAPAGNAPPYYRDPREQPRDNPECVAVRETFGKAKEAFEGFRYRELAGFVHPEVPVTTLRSLAVVVYWGFRVYSSQRNPRDGELEVVLRRHGVEWNSKPEPEAWKNVRDQHALLTELMQLGTYRGTLGKALARNFNGEARVYEISENKALVCVCPPRQVPPADAAVVEFVKRDGKWLMHLIVDVQVD